MPSNLKPGARVRSQSGEGIVIARRGIEAKVLFRNYVSRWRSVETLTLAGDGPRGATK